jgi:hypothetical protein
MKCSGRRKCQHCKEFYLPDRRNLHHQRYCSEVACRRQSKAESQRRWAQKPDNQNYFSGPQNSQRVKEWRKRNPGYWRKKSPPPQEPLQDLCRTQVAQDEQVKTIKISEAVVADWRRSPRRFPTEPKSRRSQRSQQTGMRRSAKSLPTRWIRLAKTARSLSKRPSRSQPLWKWWKVCSSTKAISRLTS